MEMSHGSSARKKCEMRSMRGKHFECVDMLCLSSKSLLVVSAHANRGETEVCRGDITSLLEGHKDRKKKKKNRRREGRKEKKKKTTWYSTPPF